MLTIVGGTYLEVCQEPYWNYLYGSGLRGAAALSDQVGEITLVSCIGEDKKYDALAMCDTFNISPSFAIAANTISFNYYHPLSKPSYNSEDIADVLMPDVSAENILMYGLIEANVRVNGSFVVYDPQNWIPFKNTGSTAKHLALVLNRKEAFLLSGLPQQTELSEVGKFLLTIEHADVVVIKNGAQGALVIDHTGINFIPIFKTTKIWPIGSGDIFSAVFAWKWAVQRLSPLEAAHLASRYTAQYCDSRILPLPSSPKPLDALAPNVKQKEVYIAGPFFTIAERWLINEIRSKLLEFGNKVFSPFHDVGMGPPKSIVNKDLTAIDKADVVIAVVSGVDPGTIFEIGYAKAIGKRVVVLAENVKEEDLFMLIGTHCEITDDFSTAIYKASW